MTDVIDIFTKKKEKELSKEQEAEAEEIYYKMLHLANEHIESICVSNMSDTEKVSYLFCLNKLTTLILAEE